MPLLVPTDRGLYCPAGDFHVDPWAAVPRAVVTHAHGDHLAWGCDAYLLTDVTRPIAAARLGRSDGLEGLAYGESRDIGGVRVSFHPAGHILGSAQVRLEHRGEVCVVSGDYKTEPDPTCAPFEPVRCHHFVTESTFGLPIYRWPRQDEVAAELNAWWRANADAGVASMLHGYALGKAQRLLALLDPAIGPILLHGAVERMTSLYREAGIALPPAQSALFATKDASWRRALVIAPPSAAGTPWTRRFGEHSSGFCSGWMRVRGDRRRRGYDRGFVISDHADWPGLLDTCLATGAKQVLLTHGHSDALARFLNEKGVKAGALATAFGDEE